MTTKVNIAIKKPKKISTKELKKFSFVRKKAEKHE
jgi:hypothetical protein